MSWRASAWAKKQIKYLGGGYEKLLLMILADYAHPETDQAWPSQRELAGVCGVSARHVTRCIEALEERGLITQIQKGNQYQPSKFQLHLDRQAPLLDVSPSPVEESDILSPSPSAAAGAQLGEGDIHAHEGPVVKVTSATSESDILSPSPSAAAGAQLGEGDIHAHEGPVVKVTSATSESDIHVGSNLQEPSEDLRKELGSPLSGSLPPDEDDVPEWLKSLRTEIPKAHSLKWQARWEDHIRTQLSDINGQLAQKTVDELIAHRKAYRDYGRVFVSWYRNRVRWEAERSNGRKPVEAARETYVPGGPTGRMTADGTPVDAEGYQRPDLRPRRKGGT